MKVTMIVLKLLFLGALVIISNQNLHLGDSSERAVFFEDYGQWLKSLVVQGGEVTGYVIGFEWLPPKDGDYSPSLPKNLERVSGR